jgi:hypothetical protein
MEPNAATDLRPGPTNSSPRAETAQQRATASIARTILGTKIGGRLPNVDDLRSAIGVGAGTVQKAIQDLQSSGWAILDSKPRQGTVLVSRQSGELWRTAGLPTLTALLPLPNSWEFQGLATGLRAELDRLGIPSTFLYGHGSEQRAAAVENGIAHFALMSLGAAKSLTASHSGIETQIVLPAGTYYAPDSVLVIARAPRRQLGEDLRIGVDPFSIDHALLSRAEFPGYRYVDVSYAQVPSALTLGIIDAAVWHRTALGLSLDDRGLVTWPLENSDARALSSGIDAGAIIARADDAATQSVLAEIDTDRVLALQRDVVAGDVLPLY